MKKDLEFQRQVRQALANYDDLDYLRACPLAGSLLSGAFTLPQDRGQILQRLLREAVEHLRPPAPLCEGDRHCRPYLILHYRYIQGQSRQVVEDKLAISAATFTREQGKALAAVGDFLKTWEQTLHPPSTRPMPIPRLRQFVGREAELGSYRHQLEEKHAALIVGPAGVGKTSLGAELATELETQGRHTIWVTFYEERNTDLDSLLEMIGLALASFGQGAYWRFLQAERNKNAPLSPESQVRYLLTLLEEAGNYCIGLDNWQLVQEDKAINALCADLLQDAYRGKLWLLVMSRATPRFVGLAQDEFAWGHLAGALAGLGQPDAYRLLETSGLPGLPEALFDKLYARTAGFPIFLKFFVAWARGQGADRLDSEAIEKATAFVEDMAGEHDIKGYLLREVYASLSPSEQRFLVCASVFRTPFDTEEAPIITLLQAEGVQDIEATWMALADRHLFVRLETEIALHPLLKEYLQHRLRMNPDDRGRIHRRVGEYYEQSRGDALEAAHHYYEAKEYEQAALLLSGNVTRLINAGQARAALEQLEQLAPHLATQETELRFEAEMAREALCYTLGEREKQRATLDTMLALAEEMGDDKRRAMTFNCQARFHEAVGEYEKALAEAEAGRAAARQADDKQAEMNAELRGGVSLWRQSKYAAACEYLGRAQSLAREIGDRQGEAKCLNNLGLAYYQLGDWNAARAHFEEALHIWRAINNQSGEAISLDNLGMVCNDLGDYSSGQAYNEQSLAIAQSVGDQRSIALNLNNLGLGCSKLGHYVAARAYHEQSLAVTRAIGDQLNEAINLNNLGEVCCKWGDNVAARMYCEQSLAILQAIGNRWGVAFALTSRGTILESTGDLNGAEAAYREALDIRREIGQDALAIEDVAGLARVQEARSKGQGALEGAREYVEECLAYIAANGVTGIEHVFEVYLTCADILEACGDAYAERARAVLEEAHALLVQRADKISDETLRRSYLENVAAHREVMQRWTGAS